MSVFRSVLRIEVERGVRDDDTLIGEKRRRSRAASMAIGLLREFGQYDVAGQGDQHKCISSL
jgi:hypothetical protein